MSSDKAACLPAGRITAQERSIPMGAVVPSSEQPRQPGTVVAAHMRQDEYATQHERATLLGFAHRIAALKACAMGGVYDPAQRYALPLYFVPCSTLTVAEAQALGIRGV